MGDAEGHKLSGFLRSSRGAGLRPAPSPAPGADSLDVALFYIRYWEAEFGRARGVVKKRASRTVLVGSSVTGSIAVVGAATPVTGWAWLGIVTAALAGISGVLTSRESLHRPRELWVQRSASLAKLQALKRNTEMRMASDEQSRKDLGFSAMQELNLVLAEDLAIWTEQRARTPNPNGGGR